MKRFLPVLWTIGALCGIGALIGWMNTSRKTGEILDSLDGAFATIERDLDISVPVAAENEVPATHSLGDVIVNVRADGSIHVNRVELSGEELTATINAIHRDFPDQKFILRGDAKTDFQDIVRVLDLMKKTGIWNVGFATVQPEE